MIKRTVVAMVMAAAMILALMHSAHAQLKLTAAFIVPETLDPNESISFVDMSPIMIGADALDMPPNYPAVKGLEIHSKVPGQMGGIRDVDEFQLQFKFDGTMLIDSMVNAPYTSPWMVTDSTIGNVHTLTFLRSSLNGPIDNVAPINDNLDPGPSDPFHKSFASLTFLPFDAMSRQNFLDNNPGQSLTVTPLLLGQERLPEPGTLGYLVSLGAVGGVLLVRRRAARST